MSWFVYMCYQIAGDESRVLSAKLTTSLVRINDTLLVNQVIYSL